MSQYQERKSNSPEDIWNAWSADPNSIIIVTTNSTFCSYGCVMGAGIAKQARERYPWLPEKLKEGILEISEYLYKDHSSIRSPDINYGFLYFPNTRLGCLQTKHDWREKSSLVSVALNLDDFFNFAQMVITSTIHMTRPGCGHGGLNWETDIKPHFDKGAPKNIVVWH